MMKRPKQGTAYHADPERGHERSFGTRPSVGQGGKVYVSGANAHQKHQPATKGPAPGEKSGHARGDGPRDTTGGGPRKSYTGR